MSFSTEQIEFLQNARTHVHEVGQMYGMDNVVNCLLIALMARSHILLEGNPGSGKTALVKSLASALGLSKDSVGRIQFTPDLMPSDITGTKMPSDDDSNKLKFQRGPIFTRLLIADEINRATPKTQAAMLEAMAEQQVTVLGEQHKLAKWTELTLGASKHWVRPPFLVMATQNPIDQDGVFPLPEAQSDRFMFKIRMPFPSTEILKLILEKDRVPMVYSEKDHTTGKSTSAEDKERESLVILHQCCNALRGCRPEEIVQTHILNLIMASTRTPENLQQVRGLSAPRMKALEEWVQANVEYELGPRAAQAMSFSCLGWDALTMANSAEANNVGTNTRTGLAHTLLPTLRHRIKFKYDYGASFETGNGEMSEADMADNRLTEFANLAAPDAHGYADKFAGELAAARLSLI